jgi:hypothetical protein
VAARVELQAGRDDAGGRALAALERDAASRGFGLVAAEARRLQ